MSVGRFGASLCVVAGLVGCASVEEPVLPPQWTAADAEAPLSHEDCVRLASRSAPTAAAWEAKRRSAEASLRQARAIPNPTLSVEWEDFGLYPGSSSEAVQTTFPIAIALDQIISRPRRVAAAEYELEAGLADLLVERQKLAADVYRAYDEV